MKDTGAEPGATAAGPDRTGQSVGGEQDQGGQAEGTAASTASATRESLKEGSGVTGVVP